MSKLAVLAAALAGAAALQRGETMLIHGAGGITGGVMVAIAAAMGGRVIATAGPASAERVRALQE